MSSNNLYKQQVYENIQKNKISYFCSMIGDNDISRAERYLTEANWNENLAVQNFFDRHQNYNPHNHIHYNAFSGRNAPNSQPQFMSNPVIYGHNHYRNNISNKENENKNNKKYNYLEFNIGDSLIKNSYKSLSNSNYLNYLSANLKSFQNNFNNFLSKLKKSGGIIIVFNDESFERFKKQIKKINENNLIKEIIQNCVIFPVQNNSSIGNEFVLQLSIISFPTYIFCKYKDSKNFYITDKMEGAFEQSFLVDCILKNMPDLQSNKDKIPKSNININENKNNQNNNEDDELINFLLKDGYFDGNKVNNNNHLNNNNRDNFNKINNNSNFYNNNDNKNYNNNHYKNNNINLKDKDEYKFNNNINFINENSFNKKDNLLDSIANLTDAQIFEKRDNEMKALERQAEEKEKKEKEEKKKELEEKNKILKKNEDYEEEVNIAKMIVKEEPEENNPDVCHIKFRFPDGEKSIERRFLKSDKIAALYNYVKSIGREIFSEPDSFDFDILFGYPPQNLENKKSNTLEEEGLFPNSILQIREK